MLAPKLSPEQIIQIGSNIFIMRGNESHQLLIKAPKDVNIKRLLGEDYIKVKKELEKK